jgi:delta24(24(1))-sterol reductase
MSQSYGGTNNGLRQRSVDTQQSAAAPATTTDEGRKTDQLLDQHQT